VVIRLPIHIYGLIVEVGWFFSDPRPRLTGLKKVENVAHHFAKSWGLEAKEIKTNGDKNKPNNDVFVNTKEIAL
jgi:hypothetical protein